MYKAAFTILFVASTAQAEPSLELGMSLGGHAFADDGELGVADNPTEPGPADFGFLGARAAFAFTKRLAIESEINVIPTKDDVLGDPATVFGLLAHARFDIVTGRVKPFVVLGGGVHLLAASSPQMDNDIDQAYYWGAGARFAISKLLDVRLDGRHLIVPGRTLNGATSDFEVSAGVAFKLDFAKRAMRPMPRPAPPPASVVAAAPPPPAPVAAPPPVVEKPPVIEELAGIGFEMNSAKIDIYSAPILERAYQLLTENAQLSIEIAGHTSAEGNAERNLELSLRRAEAVRNYLVKRGIAAGRILTVGHGSQEPIADNRTEEGRRKNRRIEFRMMTLVE